MKKALAKAAAATLLPSTLVMSAMIAMMPITGFAQEPVEDYPQGWDWNSVSTQSWADCDRKCLLDTIDAARTVVMFHTKGELQKNEAEALVRAIRRGARVEIYVGKANNLSDEVIWLADDIYQKWAATADDSETWMIGMGGCVMGKTDHPSFVVTDPFNWKAKEAPALIVDGKKTDKRDVAAAASVVVETEDFIQCKLRN
ncbi:hypothetical protein [Brucella intermedia]|uniref:hypothetical protein n=1 Tax=Brucella intermedia TaxID=94625 RepID=UPI00236249DF|nr:hypothetical protein [Brucella intermedia]